MKFTQRRTNGFTLIELLMVIAIISLLTSIFVGMFTTSRQKAKDAVFKEDIKNAGTTLETFYAENRKYPATIDCSQPNDTANTCIQTSDPGTSISYMPDDTADPQSYVLLAYSGAASLDGGQYYQITSDSLNPVLADLGTLNLGGGGGPSMGGGDDIDPVPPAYKTPTTLGAVSQWTDPSAAFSTDNVRSTTNSNGAIQDYRNFNFTFSGTSIQRYNILVEASAIPAGGFTNTPNIQR
jgi:prepilin-type N-terminal cleavage/methylation domain-containing protein